MAEVDAVQTSTESTEDATMEQFPPDSPGAPASERGNGAASPPPPPPEPTATRASAAARASTTTSEQPSRAPPRPTPTLADILRQGTELRRDRAARAVLEQVVRRPTPSKRSVQRILDLYKAHANDWNAHEQAIEAAHPRPSGPADFVVVLETGNAHREVPQDQYLAAFFKDHGNAKLAQLVEDGLVGQFRRRRGSDYELFLRSEGAADTLIGEVANLYGHQYRFVEVDPLDRFFYIDVEMEAISEMEAIKAVLHRIGCQPIFDTYRDEHIDIRVKGSTRWFYFASESCPAALLIGDCLYGFFALGYRRFLVYGKGPRPNARPPATLNLTRVFLE